MAASKLPIYSALIANFLIAVTKFIAAISTGSSAMISEGIHSLVDTGNEILLLIGIEKSKKPPDKKRPFGYGRELYFWAFIVSVLIFAVGGGISFYEGVTHLQHPHVVKNPKWNYIVLGVAMLFDGISFIIALRQYNKERGDTPFWVSIRKSKDPTTFVVLFEDAADVVGLAVAFLGIYLGHKFQNPYFDGIASIIIGLVLTFISIVLARESRSLLMGETLSQEILDGIRTICMNYPTVSGVGHPLSMYLSPEEVIVVLSVKFKKEGLPSRFNAHLDAIKSELRKEFPEVKKIVIEPEFE
jgi:cation diffusion facilitator family transporter